MSDYDNRLIGRHIRHDVTVTTGRADPNMPMIHVELKQPDAVATAKVDANDVEAVARAKMNARRADAHKTPSADAMTKERADAAAKRLLGPADAFDPPYRAPSKLDPNEVDPEGAARARMEARRAEASKGGR